MELVVKPGQWGWPFDQLLGAWQRAEEVGFDGLSCFDHINGGNQPAWEPLTMLAAMAMATDRIGLAVHVVNTSLRNPLLLAGQVAVVQAASDGRLRVGLGAGSGLAAEDHRAAGIRFPPMAERVERLAACCRVLPALWRGESVTDRKLGLEGASLGPLDIEPPPLVVGGHSEPILEIAARHGDAWNGAGDDLPGWSASSARLMALAEAALRSRHVQKEAQLFADSYLEGGRVRDLRRHLARLEAAGADRVVLVLHRLRGPAAVERLAAAVL